MIKFINKTTNTPMWVADERKEEYLAAGHKLAAEPRAKEPITEAKVEEVKPKAKRTAKKK